MALIKYFNYAIKNAGDNPSHVAPAATITVYDQGTTNLSSIYEDSAGNTAKSNPFTADSTTGYFEFYIARGSYDIKISGSSVPAEYTWSDVNILSSDASAEDSIYNVFDYGATGDGTTDDSSAIQSTIDAAVTGGGGTILFPDGTYIIDAAISKTITNGATLLFKGSGHSSTILKAGSSLNTVMITLTSTTTAIAGGGFVDLKFATDAGSSCTKYIYIDASSKVWRHPEFYCDMDGGDVIGIGLEVTGAVYLARMHECKVSGFTDTAVKVGQASHGFVLDNVEAGATAGASNYFIEIASKGCKLINNWFENGGASTAAGHISITSTANVTYIAHNHIVGAGVNTDAVLKIAGARTTVTSNVFKDSEGPYISLEATSVTSLINNNCFIEWNNGVAIDVSAAARGTVISNNSFHCWDYDTSSNTACITGAGSSYIVVGNSFDAGAKTTIPALSGSGCLAFSNNRCAKMPATNAAATPRLAMGNVIIEFDATTGLYAKMAIGNYVDGNGFGTDGISFNEGAIGNRVFNVTGDGFVPTATDVVMVGNHSNETVDTVTADNAKHRGYNYMSNYVTENNGTASITSGNTSVTVTHGLHTTPSIQDITVTPTNDMGNSTKFWIDNITSTTFDINVDAAPTTKSATFAWMGIVLT